MRATDVNRLQEAKKTGVPLLGMHLNTINPEFVESLGYAGIEYLYIDMEHNTESWKEYANVMRACENSGIFPTLRVKKQYPGYPSDIRMAFEIGAGMVDVPHVNTKEEAIAVVRAAKFGTQYEYGQWPADQLRGIQYDVHASRHATVEPVAEYTRMEDEKRLVEISLEEPRAFENLEDIVTVDGIDWIALGTGDLSVALGYPGMREKAPRAAELLRKYKAMMKKYPNKFIDQEQLDWLEVLVDFEKAKSRIKQQIKDGTYLFRMEDERAILRHVIRQCKKVLELAYKETKGEQV